MKTCMLSLLLILSGCWLFAQSDSVSSLGSGAIVLIRIDGAITPTTTNYISRGLDQARRSNAIALIIEMDTPGGLLESTRDIVQMILDSDDIPVIVYVSPAGGSAASAGTFITMSAHIAAMAPATNIGAASPVQMGGGGTQAMDTVMQKKIFHFTESYIETIADRRGRNAEWAIAAVRDGESITAEKAVELNVVDLIADSRQDLLLQIDGMEVNHEILRTRNAQINEMPPNLVEKLLGFIMRPEIMLILTMVAIYGIIGEVTNPGAIIPGVSGVIALILLLYASAAMPINTAGFALIGLAVILFIAEAFTPTFGVLLAGGAVSFFLGLLMLFQDMPEGLTLSWAWLIPTTIVTVLFFAWIATEGIRAQFNKNRTGKDAMIGQRAEVIDPVGPEGGRVLVFGEFWNAYSEENLAPGSPCEIIQVDNLRLKVQSTLEHQSGKV